ncbi:MAG: DUF5615 family PIN-like protein [Armatimonadota bacterium]
MERVFIELYLDEDVSRLVAALLRARGFRVMTTQEAGNIGATDEQQFAFAVENKMTLLTHNRVDFERLVKQYYEQNREHFGVIIAVRRPPNEVVARLLPILNSRTWDEMRNQVVYI